MKKTTTQIGLKRRPSADQSKNINNANILGNTHSNLNGTGNINLGATGNLNSSITNIRKTTLRASMAKLSKNAPPPEEKTLNPAKLAER